MIEGVDAILCGFLQEPLLPQRILVMLVHIVTRLVTQPGSSVMIVRRGTIAPRPPCFQHPALRKILIIIDGILTLQQIVSVKIFSFTCTCG